MGKDKFENEDLIKYGLNEDIWWVSLPPLQPAAYTWIFNIILA